MELTRITEENEVYFSSLLPERLRDKEQQAFGFIGVDASPVASAVLAGKGETVALTWFLVHPNERRKGYGSLFLNAIKKLFREEAKTLFMSLPEGAKDLEQWLFANGFLVTAGEPVYRFPAGELEKAAGMASPRIPSGHSDIRAVADLKSAEKQAVYQMIEKENGAGELLYECSEPVSFVYLDTKGSPVACVLSDAKEEPVCQITCMINRGGPGIIPRLLGTLAAALSGRSAGNAILQFLASESSTEDFADQLLSECPGAKKHRLDYAVTVL